jgi:hypothetical protein
MTPMRSAIKRGLATRSQRFEIDPLLSAANGRYRAAQISRKRGPRLSHKG